MLPGFVSVDFVDRTLFPKRDVVPKPCITRAYRPNMAGADNVPNVQSGHFQGPQRSNGDIRDRQILVVGLEEPWQTMICWFDRAVWANTLGANLAIYSRLLFLLMRQTLFLCAFHAATNPHESMNRGKINTIGFQHTGGFPAIYNSGNTTNR